MRQALDIYEMRPPAMTAYMRNYGWHFSKNAYELAASMMTRRNPSTNRMEKVVPFSREDVDSLLKSQGITLENNQGWDYVYVATMCRADFWGSSINDERAMALYIKDVIDDPDAGDGEVMRCWFAKTTARGQMVDWDEIL